MHHSHLARTGGAAMTNTLYVLMILGSVMLGGFIGAFLSYIVMYNAWRTDQEDFFKQVEKRYSEKEEKP